MVEFCGLDALTLNSKAKSTAPLAFSHVRLNDLPTWMPSIFLFVNFNDEPCFEKHNKAVKDIQLLRRRIFVKTEKKDPREEKQSKA